MSSPSAFQCLFCNHLNPAGASFCNECGSQLQLQQCDLCGSINKRSARACYKCGATFAVHASYAGAQLLPQRPGDERAGAAPDDTTLAESLACALDAARADAGGVRRNPPWPNDRPPRGGLERAAAVPALSAPVAQGNRYATRHPLVSLFLLLVAVAVAFHFLPRAPWSMTPGGSSASSAGAERASAPRLPALAAPAAPGGLAGRAAIGVGQPPPRAMAGDGAVSALVPAAAAGNSADAAPAGAACADAVAALGLCTAPNKE